MKFGKFSSILALGLVALPAFAQQGPYPKLTVCDPDYYETLKEKAMMEVQREIQVNNSVITKPQSVLALSCFDNQLTQAAFAGKAFSDGQSDDNFTLTVNKVIGDSFTNYYNSNFGTLTDITIPGNGFAAGVSLVPCGRLNELWTSMKCALVNDIHLLSLDSQRNIAHGGTDIRGAMCNSVAGAVDAIYLEGMIASSDIPETAAITGDPVNYFNVARPNFCSYDPKMGSALGNEKVCTVYETANSPGKDLKCADMNAIPTGVTVSYRDMFGENENAVDGGYWSYTCINPGCYFDVRANASKIRVSDHPTPPSGLKCSEKPMS
jgi:hypothetical protein